MTAPRQAQLPLLLSISEGLSRGTDEMLRVSPLGDAIHPPSCSLAIREAVEEIERLRAEIERLRTEKDKLREIDRLVRRLVRRRMAEAWDQGNISPGHLKDNPYRKKRAES